MKSSLETALQSGNTESAVQLVAGLQNGLISFVRVRFGATLHDAEDAAAQSIATVVEMLRAGHSFNLDRLMAYLRVSARRVYFRNMNRMSRFTSKEDFGDEDLSGGLVSDHLEVMIERERQDTLRRCIETLATDARAFLEHLLKNASETAEQIAERFNLSPGNVWTKKSRLIKQMHECVKNKLK